MLVDGVEFPDFDDLKIKKFLVTFTQFLVFTQNIWRTFLRAQALHARFSGSAQPTCHEESPMPSTFIVQPISVRRILASKNPRRYPLLFILRVRTTHLEKPLMSAHSFDSEVPLMGLALMICSCKTIPKIRYGN